MVEASCHHWEDELMTKKLFMMMILITRVKYQLQMFFYVKEYLCMPHLILARAEGGEGALYAWKQACKLRKIAKRHKPVKMVMVMVMVGMQAM